MLGVKIIVGNGSARVYVIRRTVPDTRRFARTLQKLLQKDSSSRCGDMASAETQRHRHGGGSSGVDTEAAIAA